MKKAGHPCPTCNALYCAEYAMAGQPPRWTCNGCGASGLLSGTFNARAAPAAKQQPEPVKKHWRQP